MSTVVDAPLWARRSAMWWLRLRDVLATYRDDAPEIDESRVAAANVARRHFLADVVAMMSDMGDGRSLEMDLALAARDAGVHIRTGVLRLEQEWAANVPPIPTGHPADTQEAS